MAVGDRKDPYLAFNFLVEIKGLTVGGFTEVTGLQVEVEIHDYREGGVNEYIHRLAGPTRYPSNLILKHGLTDVEELWKWHQEVRQGKFKRKNVSIMLLDSAREEQRRWNFAQACPVRWVGPELRAGTAEVAVETLELVHRGLEPSR
jgi:phage tail-like protein